MNQLYIYTLYKVYHSLTFISLLNHLVPVIFFTTSNPFIACVADGLFLLPVWQLDFFLLPVWQLDFFLTRVHIFKFIFLTIEQSTFV
jgi:hypothetical protein